MSEEKMCDKCFIKTLHKDGICLKCDKERRRKNALLIIDTIQMML